MTFQPQRPRKLFTALLLSCAMTACSHSHEGIEVQVGLWVHSAAETTMTLSAGLSPLHEGHLHVDPFENDEGYLITLDRAFIVVTSVELVPCGNLDAEAIGPVHVPSTPLKSGIPVVADVSEIIGEEYPVAELAPPVGEYCAIRIQIGPADDDAEGLPDDPDMVGLSIYLEGEYDDEEPFLITSASSFTGTIELKDESGNSSPLQLDEPGRTHVLAGAAYDTWLDGVDFDGMTTGEMAIAMLESIKASLHHHTH